jgi:hypothetical protein
MSHWLDTGNFPFNVVNSYYKMNRYYVTPCTLQHKNNHRYLDVECILINRMSKCSEKYQQLEYVDEFQNITNYNQISPYKIVATVTEDRRRELFKNLQRSK